VRKIRLERFQRVSIMSRIGIY